jgi:hypothetical protein
MPKNNNKASSKNVMLKENNENVNICSIISLHGWHLVLEGEGSGDVVMYVFFFCIMQFNIHNLFDVGTMPTLFTLLLNDV